MNLKKWYLYLECFSKFYNKNPQPEPIKTFNVKHQRIFLNINFTFYMLSNEIYSFQSRNNIKTSETFFKKLSIFDKSINPQKILLTSPLSSPSHKHL